MFSLILPCSCLDDNFNNSDVLWLACGQRHSTSPSMTVPPEVSAGGRVYIASGCTRRAALQFIARFRGRLEVDRVKASAFLVPELDCPPLLTHWAAVLAGGVLCSTSRPLLMAFLPALSVRRVRLSTMLLACSHCPSFSSVNIAVASSSIIWQVCIGSPRE